MRQKRVADKAYRTAASCSDRRHSQGSELFFVQLSNAVRPAERGERLPRYLHGFVIESLRRLEGRIFDAATVQKIVLEEFGLDIPVATYAVYLKRLIKENAVTQVQGGTGVQFRTVELPAISINLERDAFKERVKEITDELAGFAYSA